MFPTKIVELLVPNTVSVSLNGLRVEIALFKMPMLSTVTAHQPFRSAGKYTVYAYVYTVYVYVYARIYISLSPLEMHLLT